MEETQKDFAEIYIARVKKINKTHHAIVANLTIKKPLDNSMKVKLKFYRNMCINYKLSILS